MARVVRRRWHSDFAGPSRLDNRPCQYEAYIPDPLIDRVLSLDGAVAADVAEAEAAIARLDVEATGLLDTESLARILLRAESVASSRIEGLEVGARRLLRADVARREAGETVDVTAAEVLNNIDAMTFALQAAGSGGPVTLDLILETHRRLLAGTRLAEHAGVVRSSQNWIGGSDYNPCSAAYVPPPPDEVGPLLDDLVRFCNGDALPAVAQAAIAHAQFETIHPFADGNGRTGRALIHMILRRRGLSRRVLVPVSLVLATWSRDYLSGLTATRYRGSPSSAAAMEGLNLWVGRFAAACTRAVADASSFERRMHDLEKDWRGRLGRVRAGSAAELLLRRLVGMPVLTVAGAAGAIGRSFPQTSAAVTRLVDAGVLRQITVGRRNRAFEAPEVIDAFTNLERQLASPGADTRVSPPVRRVPGRR
jgi:Fic family protein